MAERNILVVFGATGNQYVSSESMFPCPYQILSAQTCPGSVCSREASYTPLSKQD